MGFMVEQPLMSDYSEVLAGSQGNTRSRQETFCLVISSPTAGSVWSGRTSLELDEARGRPDYIED